MQNNITYFRYCSLATEMKNEVIQLTTTVFGITTLPEIDYHYVLTVDETLCGYCAVSIRTVVIDKIEMKLNLLGLFCVAENSRKKGFGSNFLNYIKRDIFTINDYGLILNCGINIEEYYHKNGFIRISSQAIYNRNNRIQTDKDPVLYYGTKVFKTNCESVYLGSDF